MKNLMWLEKGTYNHITMKWVWYLVGVAKLWVWFVVVPKIGFEKLATMSTREHHVDEVYEFLGHLIPTWSMIQLPFHFHKQLTLQCSGYIEIIIVIIIKYF